MSQEILCTGFWVDRIFLCSNSENGRFIYGVASSPGKRASMEDFYEARIDDVDGEKVGMFGVYDGHGGVRAAEYVKQHLFSNLIKHPKFITDTKAAIGTRT
jgi:protein phosphatase 1L